MDEKLLELHMEKDFFKRKLAMKMSIEELVNHSDLPIRWTPLQKYERICNNSLGTGLGPFPD